MSATPAESAALIEAIREREEDRERRAVLRAGLIAATIINVRLPKGIRPARPQDFLARPPSDEPSTDPAEFIDAMRGWARRRNAHFGEIH